MATRRQFSREFKLDALRSKGYAINDLNDTEKARIMYLCHHLGLAGECQGSCRLIHATLTDRFSGLAAAFTG